MSAIKNFCKKRGDSLVAKGDVQNAVRWYKWANDYEGLGDAMAQAGDIPQALTYYTQAKAWSKAGNAALEGNQFKEASDLFLKAGDIVRAVDALKTSGDVAGAMEIYENNNMMLEAAQFAEEIGRRNQAAGMYADLGDYDKAIELYRKTKNWKNLALTYKQKGNLQEAAEECLANDEHVLAAMLFEFTDMKHEAASVYAEAGMVDKAIELYKECEDYEELAEIYMKAGKLHLAALAFEKVPGRDLEAAEIFERLIILEQVNKIEFESSVLCGAGADDAEFAVVGATNRAVYYLTSDAEIRWKFVVSSDGLPRRVCISPDGRRIVIAIENPLTTKQHTLIMVNDKKEILWEWESEEPVKDLILLPDNTKIKDGEEGEDNTTEGGIIAALGDDVVRINLEGEEQWRYPVGFKAWTIDLSPDGQSILVGCMGGELYILDLDGNSRIERKLDERVHTVLYTPDGSGCVIGSGNSKINFTDTDLKDLREVEKEGAIKIIEFFPGREILAVSLGTQLNLLNMEGSIVCTEEFEEKITGLYPDDRRKIIAVSLEDNSLFTYKSLDCLAQAAECFARAEKKKEAADIYLQIKSYKEAYELYKEIGDFESAANTLHLTGDNITAARHYEVVGKFERAAQLYEESEEFFLAAKCFGKAGRYHEAARIYETLNDNILAADFYERAGYNKEAGALFGKVNQPERAIDCFEAYYSENKDDQEITLELGRFYKLVERFDDAIKMFQILSEEEKYQREALKNLGQCFQEKGLYEVAIDRFEECLGPDAKPSKENIDIYYDLARTHEQAGEYDKAKDIFGKVLAIDYYYKDVQERLRESSEMSVIQTESQAGDLNQTRVVGGEHSRSGVPTQTHQRYKIIKKLGEGGMGVVYLANDTLLDREVAWKVLPSHLASSEEFQQRLLREARATARLSHQNIVSIYDIVTSESECSITMEYINGTTLRHQIKTNKQLPMDMALRYAVQMVDALNVAHEAGVVHRDVKPENIMIAFDRDEAKMVDFGLARLANDINLTMEGCVVGTIPYMAPEQIQAKDIGAHTDLYALGVILFEMMAGRTPYVGDNVLAQHLHNVPPSVKDFREDTPEDLVLLIDDLLEKNYEERPKGDVVLKRLKALA